MMYKATRPKRKRTKVILGSIILLLLCVASLIVLYINHYQNPADKMLAQVGIKEKNAQIGDVTFHYAEGPNNGSALLLLHAQTLDWYSYSRVLPALSKRYHVFAVDYPGHGKTVVADDYPMNANRIGSDLSKFIKTIIKEPVLITGNSSGGLLAVWLAANQPDLILAAALEDPPLFSAEYPAVADTVADKLFRASYDAVQTGDADVNFLDYWIENGTEFFRTYAGPFAQPFIRFMVAQDRKIHPNQPIEIPFVPAMVQEMLRGLNYYNPRFGAAFYTGEWNAGFSHAQALPLIECPVLLIQANYDELEDGTLNGAMSAQMAEDALSLLKNASYRKVDSGHVTHLEVPDEFVNILEEFFGPYQK